MTVKDEPGKRQIIPQGGQNNHKELITDKTYENGLRSTIFKKETMRKLENKINLIVVMEEVFKNEIHPEGFKVIRTVVTGSVDEKDPRKNSLSFVQSETYPDFKLWTPMFPDNRPVKKTNNQQEYVPQPIAGILATPIPQQDPESAQTLNEMAGAYPTQYGPGSGYNPQDPSRVNQYSSVAAQNGDKVSAQTLNGMAGAYPSQYQPRSGHNSLNSAIFNERPPFAADYGKRVSRPTVDGSTGGNQSDYGPGYGPRLSN